MKKIIILVSFFIALGFIGEAGTEISLKHELQVELDRITANEQIPGVTFSAIIRGDNKLDLASGYSDVENKIKMKAGDIMFSGSIGKTYAAAVILQLYEEGKVDVNDPVMKYFKDEQWFKRVPNIEKVTIRMLLNHTTGIPRYAFDSSVWKEMKDNPDKVWSGKDRLEMVFDMKPVHKVGVEWAYSDTNYIILGMIIEKVTGNDYYSEMKKRCLSPFDHKNTNPADKRKLKGLVTGYCRVKELLLPDKVGVDSIFPFNPQMEWTGGGVVSNTIDLAKWSRQLHSGKAFNNKITELIQKPVPFKTDIKGALSYGMATIIWKDEFGISYGHTGFFPGYVSIMQYYPEHDISVAIQINTDTLPEGMVLNNITKNFIKIIKLRDKTEK
ncbi:MAG: beta-lactamase family protein [Candidatus Aminicenantes bacterium]|nr:beta-lactamase family protein [Candidatus Aminicenantes bacterium]